MKMGQAPPADGRRRNTTGSRHNVAKETRHAKLAEKQKSGGTADLRPMYEEKATIPMAGMLEQHPNTTARIISRAKNNAS